MRLFFSDSLKTGNPESNVGICTLWTQKDILLKNIDKVSFSIAGNLYYADGINYIIRNAFLNPKLRYIVLCGMDVSRSGEAFLRFMEEGIDSDYKIKGTNFSIDINIPAGDIELFRKNITLLDMRSVLDSSLVNEEIQKLEKLPAFSEPKEFPETKVVIEEHPIKPGIIIRGQRIADAWINIIKEIMRSGTVKKSQHSSDQKEIINMVTVIEEDPDKIYMAPFFRFSDKDIDEYCKKVLTPAIIEGTNYTYGQRLFDHRGVDQIEYIINTLKNAEYSRRAVAVAWDILADIKSKNPPCLVLVHALMQNKKLFLTVYIRSNDMFAAWPLNAIAFRKLQKKIAVSLNSDMGGLTIISSSAHIYSTDWASAMEIIKKYGKYDFDPMGNFVIEKQSQIIAKHYSTDGQLQGIYQGHTAEEVYSRIIEAGDVSMPVHIAYLGEELTRAEIALKTGKPYIQDSQ